MWLLRIFGRRSQEYALELPCPPVDLRRVLRRERLLADRFGGGFSLLTLSPRQPEEADRMWRRLITVLKRRLRFSDEVGWLDEDHQRIGVVMHRTPPWGAWKVADDICGAFSLEIVPPLCAVYYYPTYPPPGGDTEGVSAETDRRHEAAERAVQPLEALLTQGLPAWKRCLDVIGAAIGLLALSPVFVAAAIAVKVSSSGPVFFRQLRTGLGGKMFVIYKFRSMNAGAESQRRWLMEFNEQDGPAFKMRRDPRVTAVGQFLRRTNIDELPQLWNVLKGEMSLVGPRPLPCEESGACAQWQRQRLDVTPGITCIWQIRGTRDSFDDWIRMDLQYVRFRSLLYDLWLLLCTIPLLFGRRLSLWVLALPGKMTR